MGFTYCILKVAFGSFLIDNHTADRELTHDDTYLYKGIQPGPYSLVYITSLLQRNWLSGLLKFNTIVPAGRQGHTWDRVTQKCSSEFFKSPGISFPRI